MKSGNLFTYLLYALLGLLICVAGYLVLERRKENALKEQERLRDEQELNQTMRSMGLNASDTTGSTYTGERTTTAATKPVTDKNGIEVEPSTAKPAVAKPATTTPATTTKTAAPQTAAKPLATAVQPAATTGTKQLVAKGVSTTKKSAAPAKGGRYQVVVGAFTQVENARTEMERYVKMGYRDAEVVRYKTDLWRLLAKRTNSKTEAEQLEIELERRGMDAMVVDSYKK
jgi:cell division septation protein DedD